jgi:hypothetical protein
MNPGTPIETTQKQTLSHKSNISDTVLTFKKKIELIAMMNEIQNDLNKTGVMLWENEMLLKFEAIKLKAKLYDKGVELARIEKNLQDTREVLKEMVGDMEEVGSVSELEQTFLKIISASES